MVESNSTDKRILVEINCLFATQCFSHAAVL